MGGRYLQWAVGTYNGLVGDAHEVLDVVILVLLKGREEHVGHLVFVHPRPLPLLLLTLTRLLQTTETNIARKMKTQIHILMFHLISERPQALCLLEMVRHWENCDWLGWQFA